MDRLSANPLTGPGVWREADEVRPETSHIVYRADALPPQPARRHGADPAATA